MTACVGESSSSRTHLAASKAPSRWQTRGTLTCCRSTRETGEAAVARIRMSPSPPNWTRSGTFDAGTGQVRFVDRCGTTISTVSDATTFSDRSLYEGTKHSFATDAIRRGVPERHLQRFLRHENVESTHRYARLADAALFEVLRPQRRASDKGSENEVERDQRVGGGPSRTRTRPQGKKRK